MAYNKNEIILRVAQFLIKHKDTDYETLKKEAIKLVDTVYPDKCQRLFYESIPYKREDLKRWLIISLSPILIENWKIYRPKDLRYRALFAFAKLSKRILKRER